MKKGITFFAFLLVLCAFAVNDPADFMKRVNDRLLLKLAMNPQEKVYLHTDKLHYNAGEKIWFRAYLTNGITHSPSMLSKFVYVELADSLQTVLQRVKIIRRDSVFSGYLRLGEEAASGDYTIRAYSYAMLNMGEDYLFKKRIRVLNPIRPEPSGSSGSSDKKKNKQPEKQSFDIDLQFFPEGGQLLSGNYQTVGFKAVGNDGLSREVSGYIFNREADTVAAFATAHCGMGRVRLPVESGQSYYAIARTSNGFEKKAELPEVSDNGVGLKVTQTDSLLKYTIIKGKNTVLPKHLYALVHTRGLLNAIVPVERSFTGVVKCKDMLEGIAHVVLLDDQYNIYSQRICFVSRKDKPDLVITPDKPSYSSREKIGLELKFSDNKRERIEGSFSVSVTDDGRVHQDSTEENILSGLLLTSDLKGYIEEPGYYFDEKNPQAIKDLDLVMLTHGWTKFDVAKEIKGEYDSLQYEQEQGQIISGSVESLRGKGSATAQVLVLSTEGHVLMINADSAGRFMLEGISFPDSTTFIVQGTNQKGRRNVSIQIDKDRSLPISRLPIREKEDDEDFYKKYTQNYYYENGIKVYRLDEVKVERFRRPASYSIYDDMADYRLDSLKISGMKSRSITYVLQELPGINVEQNCITRMGRDTLMLIINDYVEDLEQILLLEPEFVRSISLLDGMKGRVLFGEAGANGVLVINIDPARRIARPTDHPSMQNFTLLGYQKPSAFYAPSYEVDSARANHEYDERNTIYWNPSVKIGKHIPAKVSFYAADGISKYTVIVEGITTGGEVCRKSIKLNMK